MNVQGGGALPYYSGYYKHQTGNGLGSILGSLARGAIPILKSGARFLGSQVLDKACDIGRDVLQGETPKTSFQKHVFGGGTQGGAGRSRKRKKRTPPTPQRQRRRRRGVKRRRKPSCGNPKRNKRAKSSSKVYHDIFA